MLDIELVKLLCLPNGGGLGGSRLGGIIVKPLLNIFGQLGKIKFGNTALRLITIPSASTCVTVAFLYSLPLFVLKSSASAIEIADSVTRIAMVVFWGFMAVDSVSLLATRQ